jgi:hypothetical protein
MNWTASRPAVVFAVVTAAALLVLWSPDAARLAAALLVTAVLPGTVLVRPLAIPDRALAAVLAIATSLAITTLVSTALMYMGYWSWPACAAGIAAVTFAASQHPVMRRAR